MAIVENIPPTLFAALEKINKKLLPGGEIDDSASPELARLRREINAQRARLTKSLETVMRSAGHGDPGRDRYSPQRPVRHSRQSPSFAERSAVSLTDSHRRVRRFLSSRSKRSRQTTSCKTCAVKRNARSRGSLFDLTETLREQLPAVETAVEAVAELDADQNEGRVCAQIPGASFLRYRMTNTLELVDARHPLLEENLKQLSVNSYQLPVIPKGNRGDGKVTEPRTNRPNSAFVVYSDSDKPVMIISGANAGGKTVVLKTAGLLSLMAISGLPVPAARARVPFYRSVLADIGDQQSLSANLSTFSSHMSNIAEMIARMRLTVARAA